MANSESSILYQSPDGTVTLIDIPKSIALAQGRTDILLSARPLEAPIPLNYEPTAKGTKSTSPQQLESTILHNEHKAIIERALREIHLHISGPWCNPRKVKAQVHKTTNSDTRMDIEDPEQELEARLREWSAPNFHQTKGRDSAFDFQTMMASLGAMPDEGPSPTAPKIKWCMSYRPSEPSSPEPLEETEQPWTASLYNSDSHALKLSVWENGMTASTGEKTQPRRDYRFTIPPLSSFFLRDSTHSETFRAAFRELTDEYTLPRHFDLILLDPPWPNRSAKRSKGYEQVGGMPHMKRMLLKMDIDNYLEHNALVGVWITNKEALRSHVLGPGGLFEKWNVGLVEEWIWVKTTVHGEPMFAIDSLTRKPYEILLLARAAPNSWTIMGPAPVIRKRVIAAVPDVHSRKPCLKELLEPYMPDKNDYSALEIFSRYLVSGWMSWGNEVLKYNNDQCWVDA